VALGSACCPLKYDLLFERFLDPSRTEPPDIDIDFCRDRRQLVIDYTKQKYGEANVAQIGTFGTLKAKAAIRDVSRALSVPLPRVDEICKMVPETLNISDGRWEKRSKEASTGSAGQRTFEMAVQLEPGPQCRHACRRRGGSGPAHRRICSLADDIRQNRRGDAVGRPDRRKSRLPEDGLSRPQESHDS
jgi:hypothetical protein